MAESPAIFSKRTRGIDGQFAVLALEVSGSNADGARRLVNQSKC
jgi:hypothetical protein